MMGVEAGHDCERVALSGVRRQLIHCDAQCCPDGQVHLSNRRNRALRVSEL